MPRPFDPAIDADLKAHYRSRDGCTAKYFVDKYNLPIGTIHQRAHRLGLTCNYRFVRERDAMFVDYQSGDSIQVIAKRYRHSPSTIQAALVNADIHIRYQTETSRKYDINADAFKCIDTHEKAYWLGFMYADGNIYFGPEDDKQNVVQLCLSSKDADHVSRFQKFLNSTHPLYEERGGAALRFTVNNHELAKDLVLLGCTPRKSLTLQFPTEKQVPQQYRSSFILGYADGDGSICSSGNRWHWEVIGTGSFNTAVQQELITVAGLNRTKLCIERRSPGLSLCYLVYGGTLKPTTHPRALRNLPLLYSYLYSHSPVWLPRKRARFEEYLNIRYPHGW